MIKKTKSGYEVLSKSGKKMSKKNLTKKDAKKRILEIEYFKHKGK
jgi:hypothetical protein